MVSRFVPRLAATCGWLMVCVVAMAGESEDARIARLVRQLDAPQFAEREAASDALIDLGDAARPKLEAYLAGHAGQLSPEQRERIAQVLRDGFLGRLERRSELTVRQLNALRRLRAGLVANEDREAAVADLEACLISSGVTDAGIALVIRTALQQYAHPDSPQPGGLSADAVAKICKLAMQQDAAGKLTDEALLTWLREVYLPPIRGQGPDDGSTSETSPVVACMLMSDLVPADLFEQLVEAWVRRVPQMSYCTGSEHVLLGLVYSRHATSRHVGQLLSAVMCRTLVQPDPHIRSAWGLGTVLASPHLTSAQRSTAIAWLLQQEDYDAYYAWEPDTLLTNLSGATVAVVPPAGVPASDRRYVRKVMAEWRRWWAEHRTAPWPPPPSLKAYRLYYVHLQIDDPENVSVRPWLLTRIVEHAARGQIVRAATGRGVGWVRLSRVSPMQMTVPPAIGDPLTLRLDICTPGLDRDRVTFEPTPGRLMVFPHMTAGGCHGEFEEFHIVLLEEEGSPSAPTPAQVASAEYWEHRIVQEAVETERQRISDGIESEAALSFKSLGFQTPGMVAKLAALQGSSDPRVAAAAAMRAMHWELSVREEEMLRVLGSGDDRAAECAALALSAAGRVEGVRWLITAAARDGAEPRLLHRLIELGESYAFTSEDRMALGVEAIRALLPARDSGDLPAVNGYLLARAWSGFDFGYIVGGDPETNTSAFARYHAWADKPELPPSMLEDGEPAESPAPQESADAGP